MLATPTEVAMALRGREKKGSLTSSGRLERMPKSMAMGKPMTP
ncbi:MAG: hypothetical protein UY22_C0016G0001, partial [Candidatus Amesbacteria bacterium GW2011_GWC1_48_10]